jgi:hypothetical protein
MTRLSCCALAAALALALPGCKQRKVETRPSGGEAASRLATTVHTNDARSAGQLLSGFYGIENGAWRWTGKQFTVALGVPAGAAQKGAVLELKLTVPPVTIEKLQSVTLSGSVDGAALAPETYTKPGQYSYRRDIPATALKGDSAKASFQLDKAMPPAGADLRELGIIVSAAGLESK